MSEGVVHHDGEVTAAGVRGSHSQGTERDEDWYSAHFLIFIPSRTPAHKTMPSILRVGLPTSVNPSSKLLHRHALPDIGFDSRSCQGDN